MRETLTVTSSTVPAYTTGITIIGNNVDAFLKRFPNIDPSDRAPYRKLIKGQN
jgi:hypothetical protein